MPSTVDDRLDYPDPNPGETADDYRRRVAAMGAAYAEGAQRARDQESGDRRYASNMSYKGTKYSADSGLKGTKYSSDLGYKGTVYRADKDFEGTKYRADVDERGNRMNAGNQFLGTYAKLAETPSNYFAAQNFLYNGQNAGYTPFVQEAYGTVRPGGTFRPYVGQTPGNAAQALFHQGGDDKMTEEGGSGDGTFHPGDITTASDGSRWRFENDGQWSMVSPPTKNGASLSEGMAPYGGGRIVNLPPPGSPPYVSMPTSDGTTTRYPNDGVTVRHGYDQGGYARPYDQGGGDDRPYSNRSDKEKRRAARRLYISGYDQQFKHAYGVDDIGKRALADWRKESGRDAPDWDDATDKANFSRYVEDWRGVHVPAMRSESAMRPRPNPVFRPYVDPSEAEARRQRARAERKLPMGLFNPTPYTRDIVWDGNGDGSWDYQERYHQGGDDKMTEEGGDSTVDPTPWRNIGGEWFHERRDPYTGAVVVEQLDPADIINPPPVNGGGMGSPSPRPMTGAERRQGIRGYDQGGGNQMTEVGGGGGDYDPTLDPTNYLWNEQDPDGSPWTVYRDPRTGEQVRVRGSATGAQPRRRDPETGRIQRYSQDRWVDEEPYSQGGESANWMTDDSWATPEDKQRLAEMDQAFKPGVHRWKAGYWAGLDDDAKDLWRSYFGYRGLSPKAVESRIEDAQPYQSQYFGAGRVA